MTLYLYNANGTRVAKGSGSFSCDLSANGFTVTHRYILDVAGRQMTEYDGSGNWLHSNVFANGELLATYSSSGNSLSFALNDWLGTKRVQAKADGEFDLSFVSLPYGDQMVSSTGATEQFFTGKERDTESGNDYFGARYYSNAFGRWLSPDWSAKEEPVPYAKLEDPQSLNLYDYVGDNPTSGFDADGHAPGGMTGDEECALGAVSACVPKPSQQPGQASQQSQAPPQTQTPQTSSSSGGGGFWRHLGQRLKNWFDGGGFKTNEELDREAGFSNVIILNEPQYNLSVSDASAINDQVALTGAILGNARIGYVSTAISLYNDPSFVNVDLTALSITAPLAVPGADVPVAAGFAAYSGSQFAGNALIDVFTPDALQSDTINMNGVTVQDPQAEFNSDNW